MTGIQANEGKEVPIIKECLKETAGVDADDIITTEETERDYDEESEVEDEETETTMMMNGKSQDIFVDNKSKKKLLDEKSKNMRSSSYVVRSTKRLFKTLSFKQKIPSAISAITSSKNVLVSLAPTFDSTTDNDQDQENQDNDTDDDVLSHMSPHDISEMMKEQEEHRLQTEEKVLVVNNIDAVKDYVKADTADTDDAVVVNEVVMIDTTQPSPRPPSQALQRLLVSSMSSSSLCSSSKNDDVMMYVMANVMMYVMVYMIFGIVLNIYYNNNAKYLYEVLLFNQAENVLDFLDEENPHHDWHDIVATWL